jgi:hypothetical protein
MNIKNINRSSIISNEVFSDGFADLKSLNLLDRSRGRGDHDKIYATDYFKKQSDSWW